MTVRNIHLPRLDKIKRIASMGSDGSQGSENQKALAKAIVELGEACKQIKQELETLDRKCPT